MRRIACALALLAALVPLAALGGDTPGWAGDWVFQPTGCGRDPGDEGGPVRFADRTIRGANFHCDIRKAEPIGVGQSWRMDLDCEEMGDPFTASEIVVLTTDGRMHRIIADGGIMTLMRCPPVSRVQFPQDADRCASQNGRWGLHGLSGEPSCVLPAPDAGRACTRPADCLGGCLADSLTCAPEIPLFGCHNLVQPNGRPAEICAN
ncbi:MAG: hypothetical protein D6754_09070 [Alphaproteobacteria bacterium]|nr:MAG: hypothetical protein D6754_09070 [Alphaproteobacteria bacterium]